ncbi:MAG TPA: phosphatidylserine decarboxylase family protein [Bacteroidota bacterium]|nr:phosphatidylserine decarboxylase family protein [Bacteroidota bacterium]
MITEYGVGTVKIVLLCAAVVVLAVFYFLEDAFVQYTVLIICVCCSLLVLNFFRDPDRQTPITDNCVIAPADGKVVLIKDLVEREYLKCPAIQVSIFMSPLNVHVNRFPISGVVEYFQHIQGEHLVAFAEKSSTGNERTQIGIAGYGYKIMIRQIAGAVARRIVANVGEGQEATRGERFGMIKFGSRVDVLMPKPTTLAVHLHDRVTAGETILGYYVPAGITEKGIVS